MKEGWETKKLGAVCDFEGGSQPPKSQFLYQPKPGYIRFLQIRDFGSDKNITYIPQSKKNRRCEETDILIGRYGASVGKILTGKAGAYNVALMKTIPNLGLLKRVWFHSYLLSAEFQDRLMNVASRSAQDGFSKEDIFNFPVPVPPLPEQQRIVGILDEAFDGIATAKANAEKNLRNARFLFESHLQSVFSHRGEGWVERRLGDMATFRNGINFTKSSRGDSVKIVGVKDFQNNFWAPLDNLESVVTDGSLSDSDKLKENDLLFVRSNGNMQLIGRCLLVGAVAEKITHSGFTIRARLNGSGLSPKYLSHFLKSHNAKRKMIDSGIGTNIKSLNQVTLSALVIPFPYPAGQARVVDQLEALRIETQHLDAIYQQKLAVLDALKKSLLHQAFTGQL